MIQSEVFDSYDIGKSKEFSCLRDMITNYNTKKNNINNKRKMYKESSIL